MTDKLQQLAAIKQQRVKASLGRRKQRERRFRALGIVSIATALLFLAGLMLSICAQGYSAFYTTEIRLKLDLSDARLGIDTGTPVASIKPGNIRQAIRQSLRETFPDVSGRRELRRLNKLVSNGAEYRLLNQIRHQPELVGSEVTLWLQAGDNLNQFHKGHIPPALPETDRTFSDKEIEWYRQLKQAGQIRSTFNHHFFTQGDSRDAEIAGIWGASVGSFYTLLTTLLLSFPVGVAAAIYLEEFAPRNKFTDFVEININNLAAVPSIVFGLLGLAVFLNFASLPRSAPIVGGLVLSLMTLPTIIISSRAAIKSVPPSIRDAGLAMGASNMQVVMHHVLPLAMPGMLTGAIIGMAQALGETAPLLMIGMVAFVVEIPSGPFDAATALPVQIYLWADSPEKGFVENTAAAIMVLLVFLILMNGLALFLRKKLERQW